MAHRLWVTLAAALLGAALAGQVTPMEKVVSLLTGLKAEVEADGRREAAAYDGYACLCRNGTALKARSILAGKDAIGSLSSDIEEATASRAAKLSELQSRRERQERLAGELTGTEVHCAAEAAQYQASSADLGKALRGLANALASLGASKPASQQPSDQVLLEASETIRRSLRLAQALGVSGTRKRADGAFLRRRVDPSDPEYRFHSQGIWDTLSELQAEFQAKKAELDTEWSKTKATCDGTKKSLVDEMASNTLAIMNLELASETLRGTLAAKRTSLVDAEALLKDDQLFLQDLTAQCEARAKDWDQRSQMRGDEISALTQALGILQSRAAASDAAVNQRALLALGRGVATAVAVRPHIAAAVSLLQAAAQQHLGGSRSAALAPTEVVVTLLRQEGQELRSPALLSLAHQVEEDPFGKVKGLIQQLIERLLKEATGEATKQSFCNTEVGKAEQSRDFRLSDARRLNAELAGLEAKRDALTAEVQELSDAVAALQQELDVAARVRDQEREANLETVKTAREGVAALDEAIAVLRSFYKDAAKAQSPSLVQASPVEEVTSGPGFEGAYRGKQEQASGVLSLLAVVKEDFERTLRLTEQAERDAEAAHVDFERAAQASKAAKETQRSLDAGDLEATNNKVAQRMGDLRAAVALLDSALKTLEDLKPVCVDHGMSYAERVQKRAEEIAALERALCILDAEGMEPSCQGKRR